VLEVAESNDWMEKSEARNPKSERSPKSEVRIETRLRRALASFCARSWKSFEISIDIFIGLRG
jgi:hypothetical protein